MTFFYKTFDDVLIQQNNSFFENFLQFDEYPIIPFVKTDLKENEEIENYRYKFSEYVHKPTNKHLVIRKINLLPTLESKDPYKYRSKLLKLKEDVLKIQKSVNRENILMIHGLCVSEKKLYVCQEIMSISLDELTQRITTHNTYLSENFMRCVAFSMLNALNSCVEMRILNRLMKPTKVLLNFSGEVKFSMLNETSELNHRYMAYLPPEGFDSVTFSLTFSVWSLGLTILESCLGRFPFAENEESVNPFYLMHCIINLNAVEQTSLFDDSRYSQQFKQFIQMCLEKVETRKTPDELLKIFDCYWPSTQEESKNCVKNFLFPFQLAKDFRDKLDLNE